MDYKQKYLKYKIKYIDLQYQHGGMNPRPIVPKSNLQAQKTQENKLEFNKAMYDFNENKESIKSFHDFLVKNIGTKYTNYLSI